MLEELGGAMPDVPAEALARGVGALESAGARVRVSYVSYTARALGGMTFARACGRVRSHAGATEIRVAPLRPGQKRPGYVAFTLAANERHGAASVRVSAQAIVDVSAHTGLDGIGAINQRLLRILRGSGVEAVTLWCVRLVKLYCFLPPLEIETARARFAEAIERGEGPWRYAACEKQRLRLSTGQPDSPHLVASVLPCGTATLVCRSLPTLLRAGRATVEALRGSGVGKKSHDGLKAK
jgi:hypothetical protein